MNNFKKVFYIILFIPFVVSTGSANFKRKVRSESYMQKTSQPFVKCGELKNDHINSFASDNNQIILIENNGNIRQVTHTDLQQNWNIQIGSKLETTPYLQGEEFLLISYTEPTQAEKQKTTIRQIDSLTGITDWMLNLEQTGNLSTISNPKDKNITYISENLDIGKIDSRNGRILWQIKIEGKLKSFTTDENLLFVLTTGDKLLQIKLQDGNLKAENKIPVEKVSKIQSNSDKLYLGDIKGFLYELSKESNNAKKLFRTGGEISYIGTDGTNLLVTSNDNFLYFYSPEKEKVLWKKRLSGRVVLDPIIFQNSIFVTTSAEPVIYVFERSDGSLVNQINIGQNHFIKKIEVNEIGLDVLTTEGFLKFGVSCQN